MHPYFGVAPSGAEKEALQEHLTALLSELKTRPEALVELEGRCLALVDLLVMFEAKVFSVPALVKSECANSLAGSAPGQIR